MTLDAGVGSPYIPDTFQKSVTMVYRRGQIIQAVGGRMLVWTVGERDALCIRFGATGLIHAEALERVAFGQFRVLEVAGPATMEDARRIVADLPSVAERRRRWREADSRYHIGSGDTGVPVSILGKPFWNGRETAPGCYWRGKGG